ncbi:MAG: acetyl esterase/lipase [Verrucomicrobiales bacterium]|jgi:acetyl esterase/lipase
MKQQISIGLLISMLLLPASVNAAEPPEVPLWPAGAPGAPKPEKPEESTNRDGILIVGKIQQPTIRTYLPPKDKATGAAVVILPGGGYSIVAMGHEGYDVAKWLNSIGVAAVVVKYRVSNDPSYGYQHPVPLLDAQRAIRLTRSKSEEWGIDPERIGVLGFSAGGHLASTCGTLFDRNLMVRDRDAIDRLSSRPNFMVLVYPVISTTKPFGHSGSKNNLLGAEPDPDVVRLLSSELNVTDKTPPTFLVHAHNDPVASENSVYFYLALKNSKVPAEMHLYETGGHGFGLGRSGDLVSTWPQRCEDWMRARGLLDKPEPKPDKPEAK